MTFKTLATVAALALAAVALPAKASFVPFTVNESVVPGSVANTFQAGKLTGTYKELLGLTSATTFSASAVGFLSGYTDLNGTAIGSQLTIGPHNPLFDSLVRYNMYAVFVAAGSATSATTFTGTSGELKLYIDPDRDTVFDQTGTGGFSSFTTLPVAASGATEDLLIGTSVTSYGTGDLIGPPGAFNIFFDKFTLTAFGASYWTGINTLNFLLQTNGDIDGIDPTPGVGLPPYKITGDFSANFTVPEPGSLALVGLALAGFGFSRRQKSSK
jgi:hypothetical protein